MPHSWRIARAAWFGTLRSTSLQSGWPPCCPHRGPGGLCSVASTTVCLCCFLNPRYLAFFRYTSDQTLFLNSRLWAYFVSSPKRKSSRVSLFIERARRSLSRRSHSLKKWIHPNIGLSANGIVYRRSLHSESFPAVFSSQCFFSTLHFFITQTFCCGNRKLDISTVTLLCPVFSQFQWP